MFAPFSSGYYVGRLVVEPHGGDEALMQRAQHELVNEQLYADGEGVERLDYPLLMKLRERHFPVHGAEGVPDGTLFLPESLVPEDSVDPLPGIREVLLAKPSVVSRLLEWSVNDQDIVAT